jgi:hypothetical protein
LYVLLRCAAPDYSFCIFKLFLFPHLRYTAHDYSCVSSNSSCMSSFGVWPLITPCVSSN